MGRKSVAEQRRSEIITAFYRCVVQDGFAKTSVRKIAAEAGLLPSAIHHYFKGRDEMVEELVIHFTNRIFRALEKKLAVLNDPANRLSAGIEFIFSPDMINEEYSGFFLECCAESRHNPRVRQTLAGLFRRFRRAIVAHLNESPEFAGLPPEKQQFLAAMIVALHEGVELQWFADPASIDLAAAFVATRAWIGLLTTELAGKDREGKK